MVKVRYSVKLFYSFKKLLDENSHAVFCKMIGIVMKSKIYLNRRGNIYLINPDPN